MKKIKILMRVVQGLGFLNTKNETEVNIKNVTPSIQMHMIVYIK